MNFNYSLMKRPCYTSIRKGNIDGLYYMANLWIKLKKPNMIDKKMKFCLKLPNFT